MKKILSKYRRIIFISIICLLAVLIIINTPSLRNNFLPFIAKNALNDFIEQSKKDEFIDTKKFIDTQKFYSNGVFTSNEFGLNPRDLPKFIKDIIPQSSHEYFVPIKIFSSDRWQSVEFLTPIAPADMAIFRNRISKKDIELETDIDLIYKKDNYLYIFFLRPVESMKKSGGKKSLVITQITLL